MCNFVLTPGYMNLKQMVWL